MKQWNQLEPPIEDDQNTLPLNFPQFKTFIINTNKCSERFTNNFEASIGILTKTHSLISERSVKSRATIITNKIKRNLNN